MQDRLLDILILGLLVLLFGVIYRKRASLRLRFWIAGWLFVLTHFAVLLPQVSTPFWEGIQVSLGMSGLVLAGVCFVLASSAYTLRRRDLVLVAGVIGIPQLIYVFLVILGVSAVWPLNCFALISETAAVWVGWRFNRDKPIVLWVNNAAALACGTWLLWLINKQQADFGIYAILSQHFLVKSVLFWNDFRRLSAGVCTSSAGLVAWAAVFPSALAMAHF